MKYLYKKVLPFDYKIYADMLDISLSGECREKMDVFFNQIQGIEEGSLDGEWKERLKREYGEISRMVVSEIENEGNRKSKHVLEEAEFIFSCSYLLIERHGLSQKELASVWGIREKDFARLDIHPKRSYSAYARLDSADKKKTLVPDDCNSSGVKIAECMNRKVQAVHTCCGFVGITNDLDVFANISSADKKSYILTVPPYPALDDGEYEEKKIQFSMSHARFFLATANNLNSGEGDYSAGKIKTEIDDLLDMKDDTILPGSRRIAHLLSEDGNGGYRKYLKCGDKRMFEQKRKEFCGQRRLYEIIGEYEIFDGYAELWEDIDEEYLEEIGIDVEDAGIDPDDPASFKSYLEVSIKRLESRLAADLSYKVDGQYDREAFTDWRMQLLKVLCEIVRDTGENPSKAEMDEKKKIRAAAIFWIMMVFGVDDADEKKYDMVKQYLKGGRLLSYIDALNKEVKKGKKTHVLLKKNDFDIKGYLISADMWKKDIRPLLIYIDAGDYELDGRCIEEIAGHGNILLVVRSRDNLCGRYGMKVLDSGLGLYIREADDGNHKKVL